jgi:hypothetical protein
MVLHNPEMLYSQLIPYLVATPDGHHPANYAKQFLGRHIAEEDANLADLVSISPLWNCLSYGSDS